MLNPLPLGVKVYVYIVVQYNQDLAISRPKLHKSFSTSGYLKFPRFVCVFHCSTNTGNVNRMRFYLLSSLSGLQPTVRSVE